MRFKTLLACGFLSLSCAAHAATPDIKAALANADRPADDKARDANRKPADVLVFSGVKPGDVVADFVPGHGYFTRILSNIVGPKGIVYSVVPSEFDKHAPKALDAMVSLAASNPSFSNVKPMETSITSFGFAQELDVAWTAQNYHDVYGMGAEKALAFDRAVFAALKPGGVFLIIDHVANAGTDATAPTKQHRIDPKTIEQQVTSVGFKLVGESPVLGNSMDDHSMTVFDPAIRGKTDQAVLKFSKPM